MSMTMETVVNEIGKLMDPEYILEHAHLWLSPGNAETSKDDIFMEFGDMLVFLGVVKETTSASVFSRLKRRMLNRLPGNSKAERIHIFMDAAKRNLVNKAKIFPISPMSTPSEILEMVNKNSLKDYGDGHMPLVVTNKSEIRGAAEILAVAEEIEEQIGCGFYVVPSSIHEVILYPLSEFRDADELEATVQAVNRYAVPTEDLLSDSVILYQRGTFIFAKDRIFCWGKF